MTPLDIVIVLLDKLCTLICHKKRNYVHSRDRRQSFAYKKKREIVKNIWTVSLIIMAIILQYPLYAAGIFILSLVTTLLSFAILDETIETRIDK